MSYLKNYDKKTNNNYLNPTYSILDMDMDWNSLGELIRFILYVYREMARITKDDLIKYKEEEIERLEKENKKLKERIDELEKCNLNLQERLDRKEEVNKKMREEISKLKEKYGDLDY